MAKNVTLNWVLPITRQNGGVLLPEDIQLTRVDMTADGGATWTEINTVLPTDPQMIQVPDVEIGDWSFRITVVDTQDQQGTRHVENFTVLDDSPPSGVTGVTVTQD